MHFLGRFQPDRVVNTGRNNSGLQHGRELEVSWLAGWRGCWLCSCQGLLVVPALAQEMGYVPVHGQGAEREEA